MSVLNHKLNNTFNAAVSAWQAYFESKEGRAWDLYQIALHQFIHVVDYCYTYQKPITIVFKDGSISSNMAYLEDGGGMIYASCYSDRRVHHFPSDSIKSLEIVE